MGLIALSHGYTAQPQHPAVLDRNNPLTVGLTVELLPAFGISPRDPLSGLTFAPQGGTNMRAGVSGAGWNVITNTTDGLQAAASITSTYPISLGVVFCPQTLVSAGNLFNVCSSTSASNQNRLGLRLISTVDSVVAISNNAVGSTSVSISPNAPIVGRQNVAVGVWATVASRKVYLNGQAGAVETTSRIVASLDSTCIGSAAGTSRQSGQTGLYLLAVAWNRILSDTEALDFTLRPWQIFKPLLRRLWFTGGMFVNPMSGRGGNAAQPLRAH